MNRTKIIELARSLAASGEPILERETLFLALLAGGDRALVHDAIQDAFADIRAERQRADPAFWEP